MRRFCPVFTGGYLLPTTSVDVSAVREGGLLRLKLAYGRQKLFTRYSHDLHISFTQTCDPLIRMDAYCMPNPGQGAIHAYLPTLLWLLLLLGIGTGCITGPPSKVQLQPANSLVTRQQDAETPAALKVTTFNVWGLPRWVNGASSDRYRKISDELARSDSDVVLLQEVWTRRSFVELSEKAKASSRTWWTASARRKGTFLGQNGLLTLSRYPISGAEVRHFQTARLPDSLMHKGALKITLTTSTGQTLNIWNVHLQDGTSGGVRASQIAELIQWVKASDDGQVADIVGGDFNLTPDSGEFRDLVAAIGPDVHQLAGDAAFTTWDGMKPTAGAGQTLDHIFIRMRQPLEEVCAQPRQVFTAARLEDRLSDHMGMEASLTFGSAQDHLPVFVGRKTLSAVLETSALTSQ